MRVFRSVFAVLLGVLLFRTAQGSALQATSSQILYYAFEEAAGNTAADSSGNGLTGTWSGMTSLISASAAGDDAPNTQGTRSLVFAVPATVRTAGGYVSTPNTAATRFTGPFSMTAWIRPTPLAAGQNHVDMSGIIFNADYLSATGWNGYTLHRTLGGTIRFTTGNTTVSDNMPSVGTAPNNVWTHVACVYTGTQKIIYLNGVVDSTLTLTLDPGVWAFPNLRIGLDDYDRNFYGNIDEVRLFNQPLTAGQVSVLHAGMAAPSNVRATGIIDGVLVEWDAVPGAVSYIIQRATSSAGPWTDIGTSTGLSFTDSNAPFPSTFAYRVIAVGPFGLNSAPSSVVIGIPLSGIPRTNGHEEGLFGENCSCGSVAVPIAPVAPLLGFALALLLAARRKR
jgi:hypothetical protein